LLDIETYGAAKERAVFLCSYHGNFLGNRKGKNAAFSQASTATLDFGCICALSRLAAAQLASWNLNYAQVDVN